MDVCVRRKEYRLTSRAAAEYHEKNRFYSLAVPAGGTKGGIPMHGSVTAKKLRFGFIGCGGIANEKHLTAMAVQPEAELAAFCDLSRERA